ncbi:MAG: tetratricopeptide repeat protein [Pirellulaceae bacterium]|nr:tetratricopeptide repeat protein [Pirellulaceae bacterium]
MAICGLVCASSLADKGGGGKPSSGGNKSSGGGDKKFSGGGNSKPSGGNSKPSGGDRKFSGGNFNIDRSGGNSKPKSAPGFSVDRSGKGNELREASKALSQPSFSGSSNNDFRGEQSSKNFLSDRNDSKNSYGNLNFSNNNQGKNQGKNSFSNQFNERHQNWHRGFSSSIFVGQPWGWSSGWGGNGYGNGQGWGVGNGWNDWWGPGGYAPLAFQSGYRTYQNPYCLQPLVLGSTIIDYSQPLIPIHDLSLYGGQAGTNDSLASYGLAQFEQARRAFFNGDYSSALGAAYQALERLPSDEALREFVSLVHFAQGNYRESASAIHSVLAVGPGWSWATLSSLYPDVAVYTHQLRAAEAYQQSKPNEAYPQFLLAYHYLTTGHRDAAANQLRRLLAVEPNDRVAAQLLTGLTAETSSPPQPTAKPRSPSISSDREAEVEIVPAAVLPAPMPPKDGQGSQSPDTDALVGAWTATREDGSMFKLNIDATNRFNWVFTQRDQSNEMTGKYSLANNLLVLESAEGGAMIGRVSDISPNQFRFKLVGAPENDPGLIFQKKRE